MATDPLTGKTLTNDGRSVHVESSDIVPAHELVFEFTGSAGTNDNDVVYTSADISADRGHRRRRRIGRRH